MTCAEFREDAFDYLAGTLERRAAFQEHYASCSACAGLLRGIEANEATLLRARAPQAPADLWPRIAARLSAPRPVRTPWTKMAAAAAVFVMVLGFIFSAAPRAPHREVVIREMDVETRSAFALLVPAYEDGEAADSLFRSER